MSTSASHMLSMDFDEFARWSFDLQLNYMDSGLIYFHYLPASPSFGGSVGREFDFCLLFIFVVSPPCYSPMESTVVSRQALTYLPFCTLRALF